MIISFFLDLYRILVFYEEWCTILVMTPIELSLVIPIYRQEDTILHNLNIIIATLEQTRFSFEIIAVVDGFVDRSFKILEDAHLSHVKVIGYEKNHGKSYAIRKGIEQTKGEFVMFLDSGMEIDTSGISMLMEHMIWYEADVIVGSKRHPASMVDYTRIRKVLSYGYYWFVRILFGINVRDTQAGIKLFRRKVIETILPKLVEKKFCGDLEMLVVAKACGYGRIYEAPIKLNYHFASVTSARTLEAIRGMFLDTLAIWYRRYLKRHYR